MPTNKLWIEHTERAAWDSVEALRERLAKAEERLQALLPSVDNLPLLVEKLQQAKLSHAAQAQGLDEVVDALLARIDGLQQQLEAAREPQRLVVSFEAPPPRARLDSDELDERAPESSSHDDDIAGFTQIMQRRHDAARSDLPRDVNRLLSLAEAKLDDLTELEGGELRDAAVELALVAARIYEISRARA
jgi:hypothetical protein